MRKVTKKLKGVSHLNLRSFREVEKFVPYRWTKCHYIFNDAIVSILTDVAKNYLKVELTEEAARELLHNPDVIECIYNLVTEAYISKSKHP